MHLDGALDNPGSDAVNSTERCKHAAASARIVAATNRRNSRACLEKYAACANLFIHKNLRFSVPPCEDRYLPPSAASLRCLPSLPPSVPSCAISHHHSSLHHKSHSPHRGNVARRIAVDRDE